MKFKFFIENIQWSSDLFDILFAVTKNTVKLPLSQKLFEKIINPNKKRIFFHICSRKNADKILKMQNKKTKPVSCFIKTDLGLLHSGIHGGNDYIMVLKGISLSDFPFDASSIPDKKGKYRFIPISLFNKNNEKIINLYKTFLFNFLNTNKDLFSELFKKEKNKIDFIALLDTFDKNEIFLLGQFIQHFFILKKPSEIKNKIKNLFIKQCFEFWKKIINRYKFYNTFNSEKYYTSKLTDYTESIVVNYEVIEILSFKKKSFGNPSYKFKYFNNIIDIKNYINNYTS